MRMRDFQVQCPAKTLRARGATSKTMQIRQKCTVLFPIETRDSSFFFDALFFLIPTGCFFSALFSKYIALFFFGILQLGHDAMEIVTQPVASHHVFASAQTKNSKSCGVEILWA
jgi:hypothetical protein